MFQRTFLNVSTVLWNNDHSYYLFRIWVWGFSQQCQKGIRASCHLTFSATVFMLFWLGHFTLFEKSCQVSQKRQHPSFYSSCLELNPWMRKVTSIHNKYSVLQASFFLDFLAECPEARLSNYLNINKMLVSWLRPHLPRFHSNCWFIGGSSSLSTEDCNRNGDTAHGQRNRTAKIKSTALQRGSSKFG